MKGIFSILNYYFSPGRRAAQWPLATAPAAVGDRNLHAAAILVGYLGSALGYEMMNWPELGPILSIVIMGSVIICTLGKGK